MRKALVIVMKNLSAKYFISCLIYFTLLQLLSTSATLMDYYDAAGLNMLMIFVGILCLMMLLAPLVLLVSIMKNVQAKNLCKTVHQTISKHWLKYALLALFIYVLNDHGAGYLDQKIITFTFAYAIDSTHIIAHAAIIFIRNMFCDELSFLFFLFVPLICDTIIAVKNPGQESPC